MTSPMELARRAIDARAKLAREDPSVFNDFVLQDEQTGLPIKSAPLHQEWQIACDVHDKLVIIAPIESGKSQQLTVGRSMWELGRDTTLRIGIISAKKEGNADKFTGAIRRYIEQSARLRAVFPHLRPGHIWHQDHFIVERPTFGAKDYSVEAIGAFGQVLGGRFDRFYIDDLINWSNTFTEYQAQKVLSWLESEVFGRLTARGRIVFVCNAWEEYDAAHVLATRPGWRMLRSSILLPDGTSAWPERWPLERIQNWPEAEKPRQLFCQTRKRSARTVHEAWLERCMNRGAGRTLRKALTAEDFPPGARTVTGLDLAIKNKKKSDRSAFFTILVHAADCPCDLCRPASGEVYSETREVVWIESGKGLGELAPDGSVVERGWRGPDILWRISDHRRRFKSVVKVEDNAAQEFIVQFAQELPEFAGLHPSRIPVQPFTTGMNKHHPEYGIAGMATEFSQAKWVIPCKRNSDGTFECEPEVEAWLNQLRYYDPQEHAGDELMASWFAREEARQGLFQYQASGYEPPEAPDVVGMTVEPVVDRTPAPSARELERRQAEQLWDAFDLGLE